MASSDDPPGGILLEDIKKCKCIYKYAKQFDVDPDDLLQILKVLLVDGKLAGYDPAKATKCQYLCTIARRLARAQAEGWRHVQLPEGEDGREFDPEEPPPTDWAAFFLKLSYAFKNISSLRRVIFSRQACHCDPNNKKEFLS